MLGRPAPYCLFALSVSCSFGIAWRMLPVAAYLHPANYRLPVQVALSSRTEGTCFLGYFAECLGGHVLY